MGRPKGSPSINKAAPPAGRKKGSLDRAQRVLVGNELANDILNTYRLMTYKGATGTMALLKWSEDNPTIFFTQILSRLMSPPLKEAEDGPLVNINMGDGAPSLDVARRLAYVLAKGAAEAGDDPVKDRIPYSHLAEGPPVPTRPSWAPTEEDDDGQ